MSYTKEKGAVLSLAINCMLIFSLFSCTHLYGMRDDMSGNSATLVSDKASPPPYSGPPPMVQHQPMVQHTIVGNPPGDQLIMSIFTTFCCFMPLGIIALIKSMEARSAYQMGRHEDAAIAIRSAKTFNRWSIIVNILIVVFIFVIQLAWMIPFFIAVATAEANSENNDYDN